MKAELAGKLSMASPSAQDRLEDTLTDAVFSALRYLPRQVLAEWLGSVLPPSVTKHITDATVENWVSVYTTWPSR